jgi:hypothetical protein
MEKKSKLEEEGRRTNGVPGSDRIHGTGSRRCVTVSFSLLHPQYAAKEFEIEVSAFISIRIM